jgi:hypothetical protein
MFISQLDSSAIYIASEAATAAILAKNPSALSTAKAIVNDWSAFQGGKLSSTDEASLLQTVVASSKQSVNPVLAAVLDGATQQVLGNQNASAPTPLTAAAAALISDVVNGIARAVTVYTAPAAS